MRVLLFPLPGADFPALAWFAATDYRVIVRTTPEAKPLLDAGVPFERLACSEGRDPLRYALRCFVPTDAWAILVDGRVQSLTGVYAEQWWDEALATRDGRARHWRTIFSSVYGGATFAGGMAAELAKYAEGIGARAVTLAQTDNPYFRGRKWRDVALLRGGVQLWRHDPDFTWGLGAPHQDFVRTYHHLYRYGRIAQCNYLRAVGVKPALAYDAAARILQEATAPLFSWDAGGLNLNLKWPEEIDAWRKTLGEGFLDERK